MVSELCLDGKSFASMVSYGSEWQLAIGSEVIAGADYADAIWCILQGLAARAEANGNFVSVQTDASFREQMHNPSSEEPVDELVDKVLSVYPLPAPMPRSNG